MSTELEARLRAVGDALDEVVVAVTVDEAIRRVDLPRGSGGESVLAGDVFEMDFDGEPVPFSEPTHHAVSGGSRRSLLLLTAAVVLVVGLVGSMLLLDRVEPDDVAGPTATNPSSVQPTSSAPAEADTDNEFVDVDVTVVPRESTVGPDVFPALPVDDPRNVDSAGSYAQIGLQNPERVTALVGRIDGQRMVGGIRIQTLRDRSEDTFFGTATTATIDGTDIDVFAEPGTPVITTAVLPGTPTITLTGLDPVGFLDQVGTDFATANWTADAGTLTLDRALLPPGYQVVVEPTPNAPIGSLMASTAIRSNPDEEGSIVSASLEDPILSAATAGDLERADVNGADAWVTTSPGHFLSWKVSDTTWASVGGTDSVEDSLAIANTLEFVDEATWRQRYNVTEPLFDAVGGNVISIDRGAADGLENGMPVVNGDGLIGTLTNVTDSKSDVLLLSDPRFIVGATTSADPGKSDCTVIGRNDHVGFVCASGFGPDADVGATVVTSAGQALVPVGIEIGTIESINGTTGEQIASIRTTGEMVAGDRLTVRVSKS